MADNTEKSVKRAAGFVMLMAVPFMLVTVVGVLTLFLSPIIIVVSTPGRVHPIEHLKSSISIYGIVFAVMTVVYFVTSFLLLLARMMKRDVIHYDYLDTPRHILLSMVGSYFSLAAVVLVVGGVFGVLVGLLVEDFKGLREIYMMFGMYVFSGILLVLINLWISKKRMREQLIMQTFRRESLEMKSRIAREKAENNAVSSAL